MYVMVFILFASIHHFRDKKGTGAEMRKRCAIVSGIVTGDALVSYWLVFLPFPVTVPDFFAKNNSTQFPCRFYSGEFLTN